MAVAKATTLQPLHKSTVPVTQSALVIGGGVAGMMAALSLAEQGFPVDLIERESELGGNLRKIRYFVDWESDELIGYGGPQEYLVALLEQVGENPLIHVHLQTELAETAGFHGNFTSTLSSNDQLFDINHGVTIVATGGVEYKGSEYGYGTDPRVLTQQEFEAVLWESVDSSPRDVVESEFLATEFGDTPEIGGDDPMRWSGGRVL